MHISSTQPYQAIPVSPAYQSKGQELHSTRAPEKGKDTKEAKESQATSPESEAAGAKKASELDTSEQEELRHLKVRDREVRAHEAAHVAAGGSAVRSGAQFDYKKGPDGVMYAVGGEVSIDTSREPSPEATLRKAETIRRAALAPASPSSQDRAVAAAAAQMASQARSEMTQQKNEEHNTSDQSSAAAKYQQQAPSSAGTAQPSINEFA